MVAHVSCVTQPPLGIVQEQWREATDCHPLSRDSTARRPTDGDGHADHVSLAAPGPVTVRYSAGRSDPLFSDDAIALIHTTSRGYPRAINNLAIQSLVAAYAAGKAIVDENTARTAVTE